jgi:nitric oxide reductase NorQ protein
MLVASYNPGYQSVLKSLKPSTRQRFLAIDFDFPAPDVEVAILARERCVPLVRLANALRDLKGQDLEEGVSTRLLVYCACLIVNGVGLDRAIRCAIIEPLTDEPDVKEALVRIAEITLG